MSIFAASRDMNTPLPLGWTPLTLACVLIFLGMMFDALDGHIARMTRTLSDLGEQLDSMADMVTFGMAPAFIAVQLVGVGAPFISEVSDRSFDRIALVVAGIYVCCAALRLARFNIEASSPDYSDHMSFKGLPTPGAAGMVAGVILLHQHFLARASEDPTYWMLRVASIGMVIIMLFAGCAMISRLRYMHIVNRYLRGRTSFGTVARVVVIGLLLLIQPQGAIAAAFILYALSAPVVELYRVIYRGGGDSVRSRGELYSKSESD